MPTSASTHWPEDLLTRLRSANADADAKLKALREVKNQIIGNCTKKLSYVKLGAVPAVVSVLAATAEDCSSVLVQSAAALGSFACGFEAGVQAVFRAGVFFSSLVAPSLQF